MRSSRVIATLITDPRSMRLSDARIADLAQGVGGLFRSAGPIEAPPPISRSRPRSTLARGASPGGRRRAGRRLICNLPRVGRSRFDARPRGGGAN